MNGKPRSSRIGGAGAWVRRVTGPYYLLILSGAVFFATALLMWLGYDAVLQWQSSTRRLAEQRAAEVVTLMVTALSRDMRGVQSQVLPQMEPYQPESAQAYELEDDISRVFARFPYPESFFSWSADDNNGLYAFNRAERPPAWLEEQDISSGPQSPIAIVKQPHALQAILQPLRLEAAQGARFILFETKIGDTSYQVVAHHVSVSHAAVEGIVGFTVNIDWVRTHYFPEITKQLSDIIEGNSNVALTIADETGRTIASTGAGQEHGRRDRLFREKQFPFFFFDPVLKAAASSGALPQRYWTARAASINDGSALTPGTDSGRTFILMSFAALASGIALVLSARATRSAIQLANMKSEFVSAVTHELKTPLATIRLVSETLARKRFDLTGTLEECSATLLAEVSRLTRTIDNLLTMARIQDVKRFYSFESVDVTWLLDETIEHFQPILHERAFVLAVDVPASLPFIRADRQAIKQVFENALDNAIRYSREVRDLRVAASANTTHVTISIRDKGAGIPGNELPRVSEKFFRGRNAVENGSGLGLAIAYRVIRDHGGSIELQSAVGAGTEVLITLPIMNGGNDEASNPRGGG